MLELSGLNRQEILVVKTCADTKDFEGVGKVLIENYSGTHLREGHDPGQDVAILNSLANQQARVTREALLSEAGFEKVFRTQNWVCRSKLFCR